MTHSNVPEPAHRPMPTITCLMVTQPTPTRLPHLKKSIAAYIAQTHQAKYLVIIIDPTAPLPAADFTAIVGSFNRPDIQIIPAKTSATLGRLRNIAHEVATGDVICQWDDDDLHHPTRLATQCAALVESGKPAICLQDVLQYVPATGAMYWTNWCATPTGAHPGTLMAWRDAAIRYPETGEEAARGEDLAAILACKNRGALACLPDAPHLFLYVSHGANTWSAAHHAMLIERLAISRALLRRREPALRANLAPFGFPPGAITLHGANGPAFTL